MNEKRASLEMIAPTVEEAIAKGLSELGLPENAVEVEILDVGSRGLFGIGARQARIRLTVKAAPGSSVPAQKPVEVVPPVQPAAVQRPEPPQPKPTVLPEPEAVKTAEPAPAMEEATEEAEEEAAAPVSVEDEEILRVARETVTELLEKMKFRVNVTAHMGRADEAHSKAPIWVDVRGNDLSILLGPRSETLNALQYIASLIVGKELGHSVPLVVDVEGYRARREQYVRQVARRMADQAVKTGRRQVLEPMPANERRLVHIELRSNPNVTTESQGEEPRRKVTILPKSLQNS